MARSTDSKVGNDETTGSPTGTVVVVTGAEPLSGRVVDLLPADAIVIAADGGLDHARNAGLRPRLLVGDLDSISRRGLAWARKHCSVEEHPADKDLTDTELALEAALSLIPERLIVLAGGGDRMDHLLAALGALGNPRLTGVASLEWWWSGQYARIFHGPARAWLDLPLDSTVSLLALHGPCNGVSLSGTRWTLEVADLAPAIGRGVSNTVVTSPLRLEVLNGVLTLFTAVPAVDVTAELGS